MYQTNFKVFTAVRVAFLIISDQLSMYKNIGIKHDFLCINICWAPREVLKPEPERGPADINVSEKHVWSLLLHKNILSVENFGENAPKSSFSCTYNVQKGTLPANILKTPLPGQRLTSSWRHKITFTSVHGTDGNVNFCDCPRMLVRKTPKPCITSMWIALLINGLVPVKTLLLTVSKTAFYAII